MRTLPTYVHQLYLELALLSHGSTSSFGASSSGSSGSPGSREPSGEKSPLHELMLSDWERNGDRVLEHWLDELKAHKGGGKTRPVGKSDREIVLDDGEGFTPDEVADRFRLTPTMVRRWRVADGRDGETGVPLAKLKAKVSELRGQDLSYRQIGRVLGRSKSQVERVDKQEAA